MPQASAAIAGQIANVSASAVQAVASRTDNQLSLPAVTSAKPEIAAEIQRAIATAPSLDNLAVVQVKSAWASKINWTQAIGWAATGIVGFVLPYLGDLGLPETIIAMFTVQSVQNILTFMFKTFFTDTVTPSSLPTKA